MKGFGRTGAKGGGRGKKHDSRDQVLETLPVAGTRVVELGAGLGMPGMVCARAGAAAVLTDVAGGRLPLYAVHGWAFGARCGADQGV